MATTLQKVIDLARLSLNDNDKVRYTESDGVTHVNNGLRELYLLRPDIFVGSYSTYTGDGSLVAASNIPVGDKYVRLLADYLVYIFETADAEHVESGRAQQFLQKFVGQLST